MSEVTGTVHEVFANKSYDLRLTMGSIGLLQDKYGNNIAGLLDGTAGEIPNFSALVTLVSVSLQKGSGLDAETADGLADEMLTKDIGLAERIITAAFPSAPGNAKKPKKAA